MTSTPETRPSLLIRVRDPADRAAWQEFVEIVPQKVGGAWIPKQRIETVSEPERKLDYRLTWIKNEINVPVDDEFTFAKIHDQLPVKVVKQPRRHPGPVVNGHFLFSRIMFS